MLKPGQQLSIKPSMSRETGDVPQATGTPPVKYTVKKGDTLWLISKRFGTTISQLIQWNNLSEARLLHPGQTLLLFLNEA
jgi:LysM repeat protein